MFKNANILYEIKNSIRRHYYAKFQDLALKRRREIFYEMDPRANLKRKTNKLVSGPNEILLVGECEFEQFEHFE